MVYQAPCAFYLLASFLVFVVFILNAEGNPTDQERQRKAATTPVEEPGYGGSRPLSPTRRVALRSPTYPPRSPEFAPHDAEYDMLDNIAKTTYRKEVKAPIGVGITNTAGRSMTPDQLARDVPSPEGISPELDAIAFRRLKGEREKRTEPEGSGKRAETGGSGKRVEPEGSGKRVEPVGSGARGERGKSAQPIAFASTANVRFRRKKKEEPEKKQ